MRDIAAALALLTLVAAVFAPAVARADARLDAERRRACEYLILNISPAGARPGAVLASPSRQDPNYYYHWVRDGALTMDVVVSLFKAAREPAERALRRQQLMDFVEFSELNQRLAANAGEPKFEVDGTPFTGPWGRPQNDGPGLRALTLTRFARELLREGTAEDVALVRARLYDGRLPSYSLIKRDLEFVAHHWREPSFDLWEEVMGTHFYTRASQRRALLEGADLAALLGDGGAATFYREQAEAIGRELERHWDAGRGVLRVTIDYTGGNRGKNSDLDVAVLLAVLHADAFPPTDPRVLSTAEKLRAAFEREYPVGNRHDDWEKQAVATPIGRYPEDTYDGHKIEGRGNPWFLATNAYAEYCFRLAVDYARAGSIPVGALSRGFLASVAPKLALVEGETLARGTPRFQSLLSALIDAGDAYLRRTRLHGAADGHLSEQFHRDSGWMQGARDLTWSYASLVTAGEWRDRAVAAAAAR